MPKGVYDRAASAWTPPPMAEYPPGRTDDGYRSEWPYHLAAVAVAQVDLLAPPETAEAVVEAAVARAVLAERDRIARAIGQAWQVRSDEWGYRVDSHQEGVLDGLAEAEEIARGRA